VILPEAVSPTDITDINSSKSTVGDGSVERDEVITLTVAAIVTQVLPNDNLIVRGRQEVRVNFRCVNWPLPVSFGRRISAPPIQLITAKWQKPVLFMAAVAC
jgi:hypothetical protein